MDAQLRAAISKLGAGPYVPGSSATKGWLYNPLPFKGCEKLPCHRPNSLERWRIMVKNCDFKDKRVVDLGCATGYFSFKATQAGAESVTAVDYDPAAYNVCKAAASAFGIENITFVCGTERYLYGTVEPFDVGFALSVLNWLGLERAERFLLWATKYVPMLWAEVQLKGDGRRGAHWLISHADTVDWLRGFYRNVSVKGYTQGPHRGKQRALILCAS